MAKQFLKKSIKQLEELTINLKHMHNLAKTNLNQIQNQNLFNLILKENFLFRFSIEIKQEYIKINEFLEINKDFQKLLKL